MFGNIELDDDRSGFLVYVTGITDRTCEVTVLIRTELFSYELPMYGRSQNIPGDASSGSKMRGECQWDTWEMYIVAHDPVMVGITRYFSERYKNSYTVPRFITERKYQPPSQSFRNVPSEIFIGRFATCIRSNMN